MMVAFFSSLIFTLPLLGKGLGLVLLCLLFLYSLWLFAQKPTLRQSWYQTLKSPYALACLGVLLAWLISSLLGIAPARSLKAWSGAALAAGMASAVYIVFRQLKNNDYVNLLKYITWGSALGCGIFLLSYSELLPQLNQLVFGTSEGTRPQIRVYSSLLAMALPFVWVYGLAHRASAFWVATLMVAVAMLTAGRSGWVAIIAAFALFAVFYPWRQAAVGWWRGLIFAGHLPVGVMLGYSVMQQVIAATRLAERLTISVDAGTGLRRVEIWQFATEQLAQSPWFGIGVKAFRHIDFVGVKLASKMHPHNIFIELLVETGVIGLCGFIIVASMIILPALQRLWKSKKPQAASIQTAAFAALTAYMTSALFLTSFFHLWWMAYFAVLVTLIVAIDRSLIQSRR